MDYLTSFKTKMNDFLLAALTVHSSDQQEPATPIVTRPVEPTEEMFSCLSSPGRSDEKPQEDAVPAVSPEPLVTEATTQTLSIFSSEEVVNPLESAFTIKNLMTGEVVDLRDENDPKFPAHFAKMLTISGKQNEIEVYL